MKKETPYTPTLDVSVFSLPVTTEEIFGNSNSSSLEIGFGEGEFLVELAESDPGTNYLGIEIKYFRYKKAVRLAISRGLSNVKLLHFDADLAVEQVFAAGSFEKVYINFPDPWPKDRHQKHRIINDIFLDNLHNIMKDGSVLEFTSDHLDYVTHTIEHFDRHPKFSNIYGEKGYATEVSGRPRTKFEKEFVEENREIYYLSFKKL